MLNSLEKLKKQGSSSFQSFKKQSSNAFQGLHPALSASGKLQGPKLWLHGTLHITVHGARDLPMQRLLRVPSAAPKLLDKLAGDAEKLMKIGQKAPSDAYVTVELGPCRRARTSVINQTQHPVWEERFLVEVADEVTCVTFNVKDFDPVGAAFLGRAEVPVHALLNGPPIAAQWHQLLDKFGQPISTGGMLCLSLQFLPAATDPLYAGGVGNVTVCDYGVPGTYFPLRYGNRVTLFQDAHQDGSILPEIPLENGQTYRALSLWDNLYAAICSAQHLIYIAGWSVWDKVALQRGPGGSPTLGELLKRKADVEGVRVLLLLWDDRTSVSWIKRDGVMSTHDEDTARYFQNSTVQCKLCPRAGSTKHSSFIKSTKTDTFFTHHQKTVVLDAPPPPGGYGGRRLVAFQGGIDVTDGRFDTAQHSLFRTLDGVHAGDFHQSCIVGATREQGGPREPWHDIHSMVEGPAAWDVLLNFGQRWSKQAHNLEKHLLLLSQVPGFMVPDPAAGFQGDPRIFAVAPEDPEAWRVQVFRSIDSDSADGLPTTNAEALAAGFATSKGRTIDHSIHRAYVHAIRRAQQFIYIENQYFLGSCQGWEAQRESGAAHLIPMEIALKIVSKIQAGQRFAAYIVIPMYPEGVPDSAPVQAILQYQAHTIRMMYRMIADALRSYGAPGAHPRDYLNFFCVGQRETVTPGELPATKPPAPGSVLARVQASRRFMIYVHSKLMIVDDEYVIVGSANINQRSMDGSRDTEIATGAHQPAYVAATRGGQLPRGQVHGFRMSLWAEHTGGVWDCFRQPASLECVQYMYNIGRTNWEAYMAPEVTNLFGHLLAYPLLVERDGSIAPLPGAESIPDFTAPVFGERQTNLPDIIAT